MKGEGPPKGGRRSLPGCGGVAPPGAWGRAEARGAPCDSYCKTWSGCLEALVVTRLASLCPRVQALAIADFFQKISKWTKV